MGVVHRIAGEAALKEMTAQALRPVDALRIGRVHAGEHGPQAVRATRHKDKVNMIVHQAPGQAAHVVTLAGGGEQSEIGPPVLVGEKDRLLPVAALHDVVGHVRQNQSGRARHAFLLIK